MKMLRTEETNDSFSRALGVAVSFHLLLKASTEPFVRLRYLSNCSSAEGMRFRHSDTALSFAFMPVDLSFSCDFLTLSFCAARVVCHRSS